MTRKISHLFTTLDPQLLDAWFDAKIAKYPNSRTKEALEDVYAMLIGDTVQDDSLSTFYDKVEEFKEELEHAPSYINNTGYGAT